MANVQRFGLSGFTTPSAEGCPAPLGLATCLDAQLTLAADAVPLAAFSQVRYSSACGTARLNRRSVGETKVEYSSEDIKVLSAVQAIRRRPRMYVGENLENRLLPNLLLQESACVAIDQAHSGSCQNLLITVAADGRAEVQDDGPGWSLEAGRDGKVIAETLMTQLFACRSSKSSESTQELCKIGLAVVNALSEWCELTIWQSGFEWKQRYVNGEATASFERLGSTDVHGTRLSFKLDPTILPRREYSTSDLIAWVRENACALTVNVFDERTGERLVVAAR